MSLDEQVRSVNADDSIGHAYDKLREKGYRIAGGWKLRMKRWDELARENLPTPKMFKRCEILKSRDQFNLPSLHVGDLWFRDRNIWSLEVYGKEHLEELTHAIGEIVSPYPRLRATIVLVSRLAKPFYVEPFSHWSDGGLGDL